VRQLAFGLFALLLAGCGQHWHGEVELRLKDGQVMKCPRGIKNEFRGVWCYQKDEGLLSYNSPLVPWNMIAGYVAR